MFDRPNPITADGHRQLSGSGFTSTEAEHPLPSLSLLRDGMPAPEMPLDVLGPIWRQRVLEAATAKNAPPDYVAAGLLPAAAAMIGNSRWAAPWDDWREPLILWIGAVGNPSSGKSPGMDATLRDVVPDLEEKLAADFPEKLANWTTLAEEAKATREVWERDVKNAVRANLPPPRMPEGATIPPQPIHPRLITNDSTMQKLAELLRINPRGLLQYRDELAAFICSFDQFSGDKGGADRASWLEAYNGNKKVVDRVKSPEPIVVKHFGVSIVGTIQPGRLAELIAGADDGLAPRFLWVFPEALGTFNRPNRSRDVAAWKADLVRLLRLPMVQVEGGDARPLYMKFSDAAADVVVDAGREWAKQEASVSGLLLGAIGKARGQMVRLATVLELLRWCAERPGEEAPNEVGEEAAAAAAVLMDSYFLPMAQRAYGDGALTQPERRARTLLRHIIAKGLQLVNEREIRDTRGLAGLTCADAVKSAVETLRREDVLLTTARDGKPGRPRADHVVNPRLAEVSPTWRDGGER